MSAQLYDKFWNLVAQEDSPEPTAYDLMIFSSLGDPFSDDTVWAKRFTEDLWNLPKSTKRLNIHINSPGGSVAEAQAIYSALADHPSEKIVFIDGIAASAATIPAMAGHHVYIRSNANMMIHSPAALTIGTAKAHRDSISMLESVTEGIVNVYHKKTGLRRDQLRDMMERETWFTAQEAVNFGFCDEVRGVIKAAASLDNTRVIFNGREFDLEPFKYKNVPAFPEATMKKPITDAAAAPPAPPKTQPKPKEEPTQEPLPMEPEPERDVEQEIKSILKEFPRGAGRIRELAVADERRRVAELDQFADPACASIVAEAKATGKAADEIALDCYKAVAARNARTADASVLNGISAGDAPFQPIRPAAAPPNPKDRSQAVNLLVNAGKDQTRKPQKN